MNTLFYFGQTQADLVLSYKGFTNLVKEPNMATLSTNKKRKELRSTIP